MCLASHFSLNLDVARAANTGFVFSNPILTEKFKNHKKTFYFSGIKGIFLCYTRLPI